MAIKYATQQQGVADGTAIPADKADGRLVNARARSLIASKEVGVAWANGDNIFLGKKPNGATIKEIKVVAGATLGTSTIDIGIGDAEGPTTVDKYVDGVTNTVVDKPTVIGPKASTVDDAPPDEEYLWATIGVADIGSAVVASLIFEFANQN